MSRTHAVHTVRQLRTTIINIINRVFFMTSEVKVDVFDLAEQMARASESDDFGVREAVRVALVDIAAEAARLGVSLHPDTRSFFQTAAQNVDLTKNGSFDTDLFSHQRAIWVPHALQRPPRESDCPCNEVIDLCINASFELETDWFERLCEWFDRSVGDPKYRLCTDFSSGEPNHVLSVIAHVDRVLIVRSAYDTIRNPYPVGYDRIKGLRDGVLFHQNDTGDGRWEDVATTCTLIMNDMENK